jgi:hypothetical protein
LRIPARGTAASAGIGKPAMHEVAERVADMGENEIL